MAGGGNIPRYSSILRSPMDPYMIVALALVTGLVIGMLVGYAMADAEWESKQWITPMETPKVTTETDVTKRLAVDRHMELQQHYCN